MAQVVTSLRVPESKNYVEPVGTPFRKLPRETGGAVLPGDTYGEDFPGGEAVAIDIA